MWSSSAPTSATGRAVSAALEGVDSVVHLAAEVGVGQSMYEVERYTSTNDVGTAVLFEALIERPVRRVVTASSMSIYGEGLYRDADGDLVEDAARAGLKDGQKNWEPLDAKGRPARAGGDAPSGSGPISPRSTRSTNTTRNARRISSRNPMASRASACACSTSTGRARRSPIPTPGVLAIFAARLLNGQQPMVFEDGEQRRDFVHVSDVARVFADALERPKISGGTFNVGSGQDRSVTEIAVELARAMGRNAVEPEILGKARTGDIRHCFCDTTLAAERLGFEARQDFGQGLAELALWVAEQTATDRVDQMRAELESRGLVA